LGRTEGRYNYITVENALMGSQKRGYLTKHPTAFAFTADELNRRADDSFFGISTVRKNINERLGN